MIGKTLGHYEILEPLGKGGMGEVYRARDTTLKRDVAIKVLPEEFIADPDRLARLEREAHLLAALNHPNIATIHGLEEDQGARFLVLELVKGESLEQHLTKGAFPLEKALDVCKQIAEALEAAHDEGIIHRDLKPANVLITPDGRAKVLDFGIAKSMELGDDVVSDTARATNLTVAGTLVGTPAYMSPEQIRGKEIDKRADIWAFGCVLYETLAGRSAFARETMADTLAAIVDQDPDWSALPDQVPRQVRHLIERCLRKDPQRRLRDIGDARIEIEEAAEHGAEADTFTSENRAAVTTRRIAAMWGSLGSLAGAVILLAVLWGTGVLSGWPPSSNLQSSVSRLAIPLPRGTTLVTLALGISPDGNHIAFEAEGPDGTQIYIRSLDEPGAVAVSGKHNLGHQPNGLFFSAGSKWLGFGSGGKLWKVPVTGGIPEEICDAPSVRGASWGADDTIIFAPSITTGLMRVSAVGGEPEPITEIDPDGGVISHRFPQILPGGKAVLFAMTRSASSQSVAVLDLDSGEIKVLVEGSVPRYVATGHLVWAKADSVFAQPFDLDALDVTGTAVPVLDSSQVHFRENTDEARIAISETGTLLYVAASGTTDRGELVLVDRSGNERPVRLDPPRNPWAARFSPDGTRLAAAQGIDGDIVIYNLVDGTSFTLEPGDGGEFLPVWTPDEHVIYGTVFGRLYIQAADGSGEPREVASAVTAKAAAVSPDGEVLLYTTQAPTFDIWAARIDGSREPWPFAATGAAERHPAFSSDGQWVAYASDNRVHVRRLREADVERLIAPEVSHSPIWSAGDREILYWMEGQGLMSVRVDTDPEFRLVGEPQLVVGADDYSAAYINGVREWDLHADGDHFLLRRNTQQPPLELTHIDFVLNWFEELKERVPTGR